MSEENEKGQMTSKSSRSKDRKRVWKLIFWSVNIIALIIAIPVIIAIFPLLNVFWQTRSDAVVETNPTFQTNQSLSISTSDLPPSNEMKDELEALKFRVEQVANLDRKSLDQIAESSFGAAPKPDSSIKTFDDDSAFFEDINKVIREVDGQKYHIYILHLLDQNGNRSTRIAQYEKPNKDFERSMIAMKLVRSNSQLKNIYDAFSHVFADMAEESSANSKSSK